MRTVTPKVNKHVTYYDAAVKPHPAIVTANAAGVISLRVGHGGITAAGIVQAPASSLVANVANTWRIA